MIFRYCYISFGVVVLRRYESAVFSLQFFALLTLLKLVIYIL